MSNIQAQYETAQTLLWALNDQLASDNLTDAEWSRFSSEYAVQKAKVAKLHKAWRHECSKAAYAKAVSA
jgi:hypothetical protein